MTTPADGNVTPDTTDDGQGGTGTTPPPAVTPDPTDRDAGTDTTGTETREDGTTNVTPAPHEGFDTTSGGGTDRNPADDPEYNENPPTDTSVTETTVTTGQTGNVDESDDPAYRPPSEPPAATTTTTTNPGGNVVNVNPGSPDAAVVGGGDVNPNAKEPGVVPSGYDAGREGQGTVDTTGAGTNPNEAAPLDYVAPAPTAVTATVVPGRRAVHVHWTPIPDETFVTAYQVEGSTGGTVRVGKQHNDAEIEEGLAGGQAYTFVVFAVTQNGTGRRSAPSNQVVIPTGDIKNDPSGRDEGV